MFISKIYNAVKRLKTSDLLYFEEQFMYGHREILLHYCMQKTPKLSSNMILNGSINHGFSYQENMWKIMLLDASLSMCAMIVCFI